MKQSSAGVFVILSMCIGIFCVGTAFSQQAAGLGVADPAVCTNIENRACVDPKTEFSLPIDKLYCFTRITGAKEDTEITHVWYYGDIERARIPLAVRSSSYRTYSSKKIQAYETGKWRVEILDSGGAVLKTIPFEIVP